MDKNFKKSWPYVSLLFGSLSVFFPDKITAGQDNLRFFSYYLQDESKLKYCGSYVPPGDVHWTAGPQKC